VPPGTYEIGEMRAPRGYHFSDGTFAVTISGSETETRSRRHAAMPLLRIKTTDAADAPLTGSCWKVIPAGQNEGGWNQCDDDDLATDGTTTMLELDPGPYELIHLTAPDGIDRIDDTTFTMGEADTTLTFKLEPAIAPHAVIAPAIQGAASVGSELSGDRGTWTGSEEIDYFVAWQRCDTTGSSCTELGDHDLSYTIAAEDAGHALRLRVSARNDGGRETAYSPLLRVTDLRAPEMTAPPEVTGSIRLRQRLTAAPGTWTNAPAFAYQWQRCLDSCQDITGATGATYTTGHADADRRMRVIVTASNDAGSASATSAATEPIDDDPYLSERPRIFGTANPGEVLDAGPGHWVSHYGSLQFVYRWLRCEAAAPDTCTPLGYGEHYRVSYADEGHRLRVEVTGTDAGGSATGLSNPTWVVPTLRPINTSPPSIRGTLRLGETLQGHVGTWTSGDGSRMRLTFSWQRCEADGTQCATIPGQPDDIRAARYTLTRADVGHTLRVQVRGVNASGERYAYSALTDVLHLQPPRNLEAPTIRGTIRLGDTLGGHIGRWEWPAPRGTRFSFQWQRCAADGSGCANIAGADDSTYTLTRADVGHRVRVQVRAASAEGDTYAHSALSDVLELRPPVNVSPPAIHPGTLRVGRTLGLHVGRWQSWQPTLRYSYGWQRCDAAGQNCRAIDDADRTQYRITFADIGRTLRVVVYATSVDGFGWAQSAPTGVIAP
jgi:hypothetical protein